jgi:hypothetical protein
MDCKFSQVAADLLRCSVCGREVATTKGPTELRATCGFNAADVPRGFGDTLHAVFIRLGIAALWRRWKGGKPCGCDHRRATLNRWLPYR